MASIHAFDLDMYFEAFSSSIIYQQYCETCQYLRKKIEQYYTRMSMVEVAAVAKV